MDGPAPIRRAGVGIAGLGQRAFPMAGGLTHAHDEHDLDALTEPRVDLADAHESAHTPTDSRAGNPTSQQDIERMLELPPPHSVTRKPQASAERNFVAGAAATCAAIQSSGAAACSVTAPENKQCDASGVKCYSVDVSITNASVAYQMAFFVRMYIPGMVAGDGSPLNTGEATETFAVYILPRFTKRTLTLSPMCCCPSTGIPQRIDVTYFQLADSLQFTPLARTTDANWPVEHSDWLVMDGENPIYGMLPVWRNACTGNDQWVLPGGTALGPVLDAGKSSNGTPLRRFSIALSSLNFSANQSRAGLNVTFSAWPQPVIRELCSSTTPYTVAIVLLAALTVGVIAVMIWYMVTTPVEPPQLSAGRS